MGDLPHRVPADPRYFTADVHITPDGRARIGNHTYTPEQYGDLLRRNGWDGRTPLRLIGCDAGTNDFARRLSTHTGADVLAPTKPAWTDTRGRVYTSDADIDPDGNRHPRIPPNGQWNTHRPDGTTTRATDDGYAPGTHDHDKSDLDPTDARDRADDGTNNDGANNDADDPHADPEHEPIPSARVVRPDEDGYEERFVEWDRPTHRPVDPNNPDAPPRPIDLHDPVIQAPHRDRANVPDGNTDPDALKPIENPDPVPEPLRGLEGHDPLRPWTGYPVQNANGTTTTFFTDRDGTVKWVEATPGSAKSFDGNGKWSGFNPDLGHPLLPDVKYRVPNFNNPEKFLDFHTDRHGQTDSVSGEVEARKKEDGVPGTAKERRDEDSGKGAQKRAAQEGEAAYPSSRARTDEEIEDARVMWAGGHLVANELGGLGEYLNMHPQMAASNSGNKRDGWFHTPSWRAQEEQLAALSRSTTEDVRNYQVRMTRGEDGVASEVTMRWQHVTYQLDASGSVVRDANGRPTVESVVTKERVFPNRPGVNYGPQDRYSRR